MKGRQPLPERLALGVRHDIVQAGGTVARLKHPGVESALAQPEVLLGGIHGLLRGADLLARADSALAIFGAKGDVLRAAARFVAERKN